MGGHSDVRNTQYVGGGGEDDRDERRVCSEENEKVKVLKQVLGLDCGLLRLLLVMIFLQ